MLISSSVAVAGLPTGLAFDQYTATNGVITPSTGSAANNYCATGFTCDAPISGDGFYQRQVTDNATGVKYFQTIVLDKQSNIASLPDFSDPAKATFADESFVQQGAGTGIGNKSRVNAQGTGADTTVLHTTSSVFTGTAFSTNPSATNGDLTVNQTLDDSATLTHIGFDLTRAAGATAPDIALDSTVYLVDNGVTPTTASPKQLFVLRQSTAAGAGYLSSDGTATGSDLVSIYGLQSTSNPTGAKLDPTSASTPLAYVAGDTIQLMWVAQQVVTDPTSTPVGAQSFGAETLSVNPDPATAGTTTPATESYSNQSVVGAPIGTTPETYNPYLWVTTFGTQPVF